MPSFHKNISQPNSDIPDGSVEWSRRSFLKLLGMGALSTSWMFSSCRGPARHSIPHNKSPEWTLPGAAVNYSTSWFAPWGSIPLMVTTHEGRPTMLEANMDHPDTAGCPTHSIASLWDLYSPDRSREILFKGKPVLEGEPIGPAEFDASYKALAKKITAGARVAIITENYDSPTLQYIVSRLQSRNPNLKLYRDDSFRANHLDVVLEQIYDSPVRIKVNYDRINCIVSLDRDFLGIEPMGSPKEFFKKRNPDSPQDMNRLYCSEGILSLTGGMADMRRAVSPDKIGRLVSLIAEEISKKIDFPPLAVYCNSKSINSGEQQRNLAPETLEWVHACAKDLIKNKGKSLLLLGDRYSPQLHYAVLVINGALQAFGEEAPLSVYSYPYATPPSWEELIQEQGSDNFPEILIWLSEGMPAPTKENIEFLQSMKDLDSYHLGLYPNSLAKSFRWHVPVAHFLESWGDHLSPNHTLSVQQPVILPLHNGVSPLEFLLGLIGGKGILATTDTVKGNVSPSYSAVKSLFIKRTQTKDKELTWNHALKQGYHLSEVHTISKPLPAIQDYKEIIHKSPFYYTSKSNNALTCFLLKSDYSLLDGRYINNAWLQECPDPISKIVWGNTALVSPSSQKKINTNFIRIKTSTNNETTYPLTPIPGMADNLIVLPMGYGQPNTGIVGERCGFSPPVFGNKETNRTWSYISAKGNKMLAPVFSQPESSSSEIGHIKETHVEKKLPNPRGKDFLHQWGMCIDLSKCIGCNACVLACQAENNIPIVGREQASHNRLMHWLHVDRYFRKAENGYVEMLVQPRACQQCENAPCESVCPLNATTHTQDGLNAMTYARCVGTRYCASNCPYKVRRFNYFDYNKYNPYLEDNLMKGAHGEKIEETSLRLQRNPHVSVRMRGVMEKCTYCVQRIEAAKVRQKQSLEKIRQETGLLSSDISLDDHDLRIPPDSFQCACQAACPAGAITFGNLLDGEKSAIGKARQSPRAYTLLDHLNVLPRTAYLARIRNTPDPT